MADFSFTSDTDLTDQEIETTQKTYDEHALDYVTHFERHPYALKHAKPFTIDPFLSYYESFKLDGPILFAGCGSGRDMEVISKKGIECVGVDISPNMVKLAKRYCKSAKIEVADLRNLNFPNNFFSGIFCESALSHVKKSELQHTILGFSRTLRRHGIALLTFRQNDGHVYYTEDLVGGKRYNTTILRSEIDRILAKSDLATLSVQIHTHPVSDRPAFINFFVEKI